jgi:putative endonuclease
VTHARRRTHRYFVYIMSSQTRVLYTGVTNDLERRVDEHKRGALPGFSSTYRTRSLVFWEETSDVREAVMRERSLKGKTRAKKVALIEEANPEWHDLSDAWTVPSGEDL